MDFLFENHHINNYDKIKLEGRGCFGSVYIVKDKIDKRRYAMKIEDYQVIIILLILIKFLDSLYFIVSRSQNLQRVEKARKITGLYSKIQRV
jgi:hypothetical protein